MSDAIRRGIRTAIAVLVAAATGLTGLVAVHVITAEQGAKVGAVLIFLAGIITAGWNALEDADKVPSVLKATASSGANPVTHDPA